MGQNSNIEWTEQTWNPLAGCTRISPGCQNCYAERMAKRLIAMGQEKYQGTVDKNGRWTGALNFDVDNWDAPTKRKKPTMYFVNSMSDLFHADVPPNWSMRIWDVMAKTPQHTYQILTKRADVMEQRVKWLVDLYGVLPNVWLGVSVENQQYADERIPHLLQTPAAVRFLSCEPLLGPVSIDLIDGVFYDSGMPFPWQKLEKPGIDWVIVGGESAPNARPMHPNWARSLRDQCKSAGVAFFMKQWGEWIAKPQIATFSTAQDWPDWEFHPGWRDVIKGKEWGCLGISGKYLECTTTWNGRQGNPDDDYEVTVYKVGKHAAGRLLDGETWSEFPQP